MKIVLSVYDFFRHHTVMFYALLVSVFLLCGVSILRLDYKEDISDFLPFTKQQRQAFDIYRQISGAERIVVIFEGGDTEQKEEAVDAFAVLCEQDSVLRDHLTCQIDMQLYLDGLHRVYAHIPYFLTEADYERIDSLLQAGDAVKERLANSKRLLQMPVSSFVQQTISDDPLGLFAPVVASLQHFQPATQAFISLDGYMLTRDERMAFAIVNTPYGANETKQNTKLVRQLEELISVVQQQFPMLNIRLNGAPVVAVDNANRIKKDSVLTVSLAVVLIICLLLYSFRRNLRSMPLIVLTITFGWLFGMAVVGWTGGQISVIVLGIGSIIIGIAVNYPLHIVFHQRYTASVRQTLGEVVSPLVIGNITTVGAFLALIPLQATALRDLGIFAAAMLIGTILFSLFFLPQMMKKNAGEPEIQIQPILHQSKPDKRVNGIALALLTVLTVLFFFIGKNITFDADISHLNYLTEQQSRDFAYFASVLGEKDTEDIYIAEDWNDATGSDVSRWLPSEREQTVRLKRWRDFWADKKETLERQLQEEAGQQGFRKEVFQPFLTLLSADLQPVPFNAFLPLAENMLRGYWLQTDTTVLLVSRRAVSKYEVEREEKEWQKKYPQALVFTIRSLNQSLARQLTESFDYLGWVCSLLVFCFLWLTMHSWRRAVVAFLPMVVSWIWIMGLMHLFGLQFNIVNVILATFIFGQGDDYTIFVVEGLISERETGKTLLPQYRRSIILSALIMFIGMGVLVLAGHPAMYSLGAVTLIGMAVVVLMANILPPLLKQYSVKNLKRFDHITQRL